MRSTPPAENCELAELSYGEAITVQVKTGVKSDVLPVAWEEPEKQPQAVALRIRLQPSALLKATQSAAYCRCSLKE